MQEGDVAKANFEALWKLASETPVQYLDSGEDEDIDRAAALGAWIEQIAEACLAGGLIAEADHAELKRCGETVTRILGAVPPDALQAELTGLGPDGPGPRT
ncbi:hypothetical protein [Rubellimicrobium arenae]|uniref:hypothetical protein n=1 Tax=Rubellimicrobium arenae TaxID=2817372 RepID=UPI001B307C00|nr:hypothetical protein [Rubellimicrobium arenae]